MDRALSERTAVLETNDKNIFHQLDEIKTEVQKLHHLTLLCEGIMTKLSLFEEKLSHTESRLEALERAPSEDYRHYKRSVVTYLITALLATGFGALGVLLTNG